MTITKKKQLKYLKFNMFGDLELFLLDDIRILPAPYKLFEINITKKSFWLIFF